MSAAFVGRQSELDTLTALPRLSRQASGGVGAVVVGPPGSGKTRLLAEVTGHLDGLRIARIVGYEPVHGVPLAAVGDLLRELGVDGGDSRPIASPSGTRAFAPRPAPDPLRIFEAAHRARVADGPTVMILDDLQWIDDLSLGLVHYILRAAESSHQPLTVIAATRPSSAGAAFRDALASVLPDSRRFALELRSLSLADGLAMARTLDPDLDVARATTLWRRAEGSPFWLEALALARDDDPSDVIGGRLAGLDEDAASVLSAAAVAARPLAVAELAGVLDWPEERVHQAVHELGVRGLVLVAGAGVRFAHDLIRESALAGLPAPVVRRLHGRIADWIEADQTADLSSLQEALEHRDAAGLPTVQLAARILSSPRRRLLGSTGLRLLVGIAGRLDPSSPERLSLEAGLAELASGLGEQEIAIEHWTWVSERAPDARTRRRAGLAAATAAYRLGRTEDARTQLDRTRAIIEDHPGDETAMTMSIEFDATQALLELWLEHRTADGVASATRAVHAARAMLVSPGGIGELSQAGLQAFLAALESACDAALQDNRTAELPALSREIELIAGRLDDEAAFVGAMTRVGSELPGSGDAERVLRRAWVLAKERILPSEAVEAGHWLARSLQGLGRLAEAHAVAQETAELEARLGHGSRQWSLANPLVHNLELSLGDQKTALAALRGDADHEPDRHHEFGIRQTIAEWQAWFSGVAGARDIDAQLVEARVAAAEVRCPRCSHELAIVDAEIQARLDRVAQAELGLASWLAAGGVRQPAEELWLRRAETAIALATNDGPRAQSAAEAAIALARKFESAPDELRATIDLGRANELIDPREAVSVYTGAAAMAGRMGAASEGRLAASALRRLGVRAWRRSPGPTGSEGTRPGSARTRADPYRAFDALSARELEIARWVASGATNAEIADALMISPRTVDRHVTNIFAKLGVRNRAELASQVRGSTDDPGGPAS